MYEILKIKEESRTFEATVYDNSEDVSELFRALADMVERSGMTPSTITIFKTADNVTVKVILRSVF